MTARPNLDNAALAKAFFAASRHEDRLAQIRKERAKFNLAAARLVRELERDAEAIETTAEVIAEETAA